MICWHKWSKWERFEQPMVFISRNKSEEHNYIEIRQRRKCIKCGRIQEEKIV